MGGLAGTRCTGEDGALRCYHVTHRPSVRGPRKTSQDRRSRAEVIVLGQRNADLRGRRKGLYSDSVRLGGDGKACSYSGDGGKVAVPPEKL